MKSFTCPSCTSRVHFDSMTCENCGDPLAYDIAVDGFVAGSDRTCVNRDSPEMCNWVAVAGAWCMSCGLDTEHAATVLRHPFQQAKRRVMRQLATLGIDVTAPPGARFEMREGSDDDPVLTGHADGLITLNTAEGRPDELASVQTAMGEPYRTPLGHVRHELGHWYWQSHRDVTFTTESFRSLFGDERTDYAAALEAHYASSDDGRWKDGHISFYAASHPWEDFAESFAHSLHILDTSETAWANQMSCGRPVPEALRDFDDAYDDWVDLTVVINELNRSMGTPDAYPFAPGPRSIEKIRFVVDSIASRS